MRQRVRWVALACALVAAGLTGGGAPVVAQDHGETVRLLVIDAVTNVMHVVDAETGQAIASFNAPGPGAAYAASSGRYFVVTHREHNRVTIIDSGLRLQDHGDHSDLVKGAPYVRATINTGRKPTHFWSHDDLVVIVNDDDPSVVVFEEKRLDLSTDYTEVRTARAGHNASVAIGDDVVVGFIATGTVDVYDMAGRRQATFEGCPALHGEATLGTMVAFGCADGVLVVERRGGEWRSTKIGEPSGSPESARVGTLAAHPRAGVMYGNFGQGLAIIRPGATVIEPVALPSSPLRFEFNADGDQLVVLTTDGMLRLLDPATGRTTASVPAVAAFAGGGEGSGPPRPALAVGDHHAYVTDPTAGTIAVIDLERATLVRTIRLGGAPSSIAMISLSGADH